MLETEAEAQLRKAHQLLAMGHPQQAEDLFRQVLNLPTHDADGHNGMGLCAEAMGQLTQAEAHYRMALAIRPAEPEFLNNLAICLQTMGRLDEALAVFYQLAELQDGPESLYNLALVLGSLGRFWDALALIRRVLNQHPRIEAPVLLLIELITHLGRHREQLERLQDLHGEDPADPVYQLALGAWYAAEGHAQLAVTYFRAALRANPSLLGAYRQLIQHLQTRGRFSEALVMARELFTRELSPQNMTELLSALQHPIPASEEQIHSSRQEVWRLLEAWRSNPPLSLPYSLARPISIPFYFCYQAGPDKQFQAELANFFSRCLTPLPVRPEVPEPVSTQARRPRLGIFSTHLFRHSVTDLLCAAVKTLLASPDFDTYLCFCMLPGLGGKRDAVTAGLEALAGKSLSLSEDVLLAANQLLAIELDILIFLDVGMDAYSYALALKRLARYQLVLSGHPVTTGMPTMDFFVSGQSLEPPEADDFYTETLIRLPGLPDYDQPMVPPPATRAELDLPTGNLYFCPMTIFKIQPAFDHVLARVMNLDPSAQVLLLQFKNQLHLQLQARFTRAYPELASRLHFLPWTRQEVFFQRLLAADVILDTFPFGGGNTSYQALGLGCPMVCLDVPWQKGRWTQAMYHLMGIEGLVAADAEEYAQLAVRVARDKAWQADLREQIRERSRVLFDNPTWSQALLDFCLQLVNQ